MQPLIACGWAGALMLKNRQKSCFNESASKGLAHPFKESLARNKKTEKLQSSILTSSVTQTKACLTPYLRFHNTHAFPRG